MELSRVMFPFIHNYLNVFMTKSSKNMASYKKIKSVSMAQCAPG